jgi:hypothetical protein
MNLTANKQPAERKVGSGLNLVPSEHASMGPPVVYWQIMVDFSLTQAN